VIFFVNLLEYLMASMFQRVNEFSMLRIQGHLLISWELCGELSLFSSSLTGDQGTVSNLFRRRYLASDHFVDVNEMIELGNGGHAARRG
jgi:hypothetical protein